MIKLKLLVMSGVLVSAFWLGACSDDGDSTSAASTSSTSAASTGSTGGSGGTSATGGTGGTGGEDNSPTMGNCPAEPPTEGTACDWEATLANGFSNPVCEYGEHPNPNLCRAWFVCTEGAWLEVGLAVQDWCEKEIKSCDGTKADGDPCTDEPLCVDGDVNCFCRDCYDNNGVTGPIWTCFDPPASPCPPVAPKLGSTCSLETGTKCNYQGWAASGTYGNKFEMVCVKGYWDGGFLDSVSQLCDEKI
jgi:hypothetical protein